MERIRIRLSMMLHIGWVTYLVRDTDSTKRVTERSTWRKIKPNILSKKLGVEEKPED